MSLTKSKTLTLEYTLFPRPEERKRDQQSYLKPGDLRELRVLVVPYGWGLCVCLVKGR